MKILRGVRSAISTPVSNRVTWSCVLLALGILVANPSVAASQEAPPVLDETHMKYLVPQPSAPELAGHRFIATTMVPNPFIRTQFRNTLGIGMSSGLTLPPVDIGGVEYRFESGKLLFSKFQLEYQQKVKEWLGVWGKFGLSARLGTETQSLLTQGVTVTTGFELGWLLRLWQTDNMLLSGTVQINNSSFTAVDLVGFVEGIIDGVPESDNSLVLTVPLMAGFTGLRYAWAMNQVVGLTAATKVGYGESPDRKQGNTWYFDAGAMVDFDFRRKYSAPVGIAAGARVSSVPDQDEDLNGSATSTVVRIDYIGRIDFNLGLEIKSTWYDVSSYDLSMRYTTATMDFRYYF